VTLGYNRQEPQDHDRDRSDQRNKPRASDAASDASDVETILSLSDVGIDDMGQLSVTLDFPC